MIRMQVLRDESRDVGLCSTDCGAVDTDVKWMINRSHWPKKCEYIWPTGCTEKCE